MSRLIVCCYNVPGGSRVTQPRVGRPTDGEHQFDQVPRATTAAARPAPPRSGRAGTHPFLGAVGELLVLPDRHLALEVVDQPPARREGLRAVRAGDGDDDREVPDAEVADAVDGGQGTD